MRQIGNKFLMHTSALLGRSRARDLFDKFKETSVSLPRVNIVQVSMDELSVKCQLVIFGKVHGH